jgi:hypothetical protein
MDPNATLAEMRQLVRLADDTEGTPDLERLAELAGALDGWLMAGGFLPTTWQAQADRRLTWVSSYLSGATRPEVSGPFQSVASAERFAAGLASSGRTARVEITHARPEGA